MMRAWHCSNAEAIADKIIVTYQLESEFKKNRQAAILEGMQELKAPTQIPRLAIFSDAKATAVLNKNIKEAEKELLEKITLQSKVATEKLQSEIDHLLKALGIADKTSAPTEPKSG